MNWKPIRKLTPEEVLSVRAGKCWYTDKPCRYPVQCSKMTVRCRRELEADCDSGYYGKEHRRP